MFDLIPHGVDADFLVQPGFNLLLHRKADGTWALSYSHCNPRRRQKVITARGADLADLLADLKTQIDARLWADGEKHNPSNA